MQYLHKQSPGSKNKLLITLNTKTKLIPSPANSTTKTDTPPKSKDGACRAAPGFA